MTTKEETHLTRILFNFLPPRHLKGFNQSLVDRVMVIVSTLNLDRSVRLCSSQKDIRIAAFAHRSKYISNEVVVVKCSPS